jgi:hypothetical protein
LKNFQSKLTDAEAEAEKMLMPGAHSRGPADDGESVPIRVNIFRKYFEMKKTVVSKSAQREQFQVALQTMRNTLLPPQDSLNSSTTTSQPLDSVVGRSTTTQPTSKSLVAPDGGITLVPSVVCNTKSTQQTASTPRNGRQRAANFGSSGAGLGGIGTNVGGLQEMLVMMNNHTRQMLKRPFREVYGDYKEAKANLVQAIAVDDKDDIKFFRAACDSLKEEMKSTS